MPIDQQPAPAGEVARGLGHPEAEARPRQTQQMIRAVD
jgi:hypothetical protein